LRPVYFTSRKGENQMKINFYEKYKIKSLQRSLAVTEEKIEELMNTSTNGCKARTKIETALIKQYNNYARYAQIYSKLQLQKLEDNEYVESRLSYAGWKQIVGLLDSVYMRVGIKI